MSMLLCFLTGILFPFVLVILVFLAWSIILYILGQMGHA